MAKQKAPQFEEIITESVKRGFGRLSNHGAFVVETGKYTGRAASDRYILDRDSVRASIGWNSANKPFDVARGEKIFSKAETFLNSQDTYVFEGKIATFQIRVESQSLWHMAFCKNMFRSEKFSALPDSGRTIQVTHLPHAKPSQFDADYKQDAMILVDVEHLKILIVGTSYAGEIKKSAFSMCNYALPDLGILPVHASANCRPDGSNSCLMFGLSGTGKTTLSADPTRHLVGDDEIVVSPKGLSNLEAGCYAKLINLSEKNEPEIFKAVSQSSAILENVGFVPGSQSEINFHDKSKTENTRASYPLKSLSRVFDQSKESSLPDSVVFLTADAFAALPAVARLTTDQAKFFFVSGYTAKVAGTELGIVKPTPTFSTCFGAPFMPRPSGVYAKLLNELLLQNQKTTVWLLNTGWIEGGPVLSDRIPLSVSRALLHAIQDGSLNQAPMVKHPIFGFDVPTSCSGVEAKYLKIPSGEQVLNLAKSFVENYRTHHLKDSGEMLLNLGGPRI